MQISIQTLMKLLARSRLYQFEEVQAMHKRWRDQSKGAGQTEEFCKWLTANNYITEYQAGLLARGHSDGFFLNEYKILDRIGRGHMAGVYKAEHALGQIVAIKVLPPSRAKQPDFLARFQREARLLLRLNHPNVVRGFDLGEDNGHHFVVMEYLEGETLLEVLQRRQRLEPLEAIRLAHQALLGLQHVHESGLVHRDLKPANLMLVPRIPKAAASADTTITHNIKIVDIGLGRTQADLELPSHSNEPELTSAGVLLGTPDYMAPEQARDARSADIRADLYSLGCVLYHALTGRPPFPDTNIISQMVRHATEIPRPLKKTARHAPEGLQEVLDRLMAKDPGDRYVSPAVAATALAPFLTTEFASQCVPETSPQLQAYFGWLRKSAKAEVEANTTELLLPRPDGQAEIAGEGSPAVRQTVQAPLPPRHPDQAQKKETKSIASPSAQTPRESRRRRAAVSGLAEQARRPSLPDIIAKSDSSPMEEMKEAPADDGGEYSWTQPGDPSSFDVELVFESEYAQQPGRMPTKFRLSVRDLIMLGIGAGGTLIAVLVGWLLARALS